MPSVVAAETDRMAKTGAPEELVSYDSIMVKFDFIFVKPWIQANKLANSTGEIGQAGPPGCDGGHG